MGRPGDDRGVTGLPFFVYGTLRPGLTNHDAFLQGRTAAEEPARLPGARLYDGPGYPYLRLGGTGEVRGELVYPAPGRYGELLAALDGLEEYLGPRHPRNLYEREACEAVRLRDGGTVRAWVYVAAERVPLGPPVPDGDWLSHRRRTPDGPRTP
ncbi:gamma-glutamylcyclotransferase [Streptomyces sp. MUM 203J]|uniref:gamma-glutamylcyclotransferase family protein n=1 Tax=Streptomyces sp. MUM 203J TaxID=2791990 RepID=UPI001F03988E|nr:gamma-glutamylcyclotransferase family protein [Streptomyces sp. MUM 203J]MCH0540657.1 gamma-glutamylcyclotransferase [Streptomyces sp. MUM 203J]